MQGTQRRSIFRRRKAGLTDYRRRLKLLRGRKPRAVVRISNTRTTCQLVDWAASGDLVKVTSTGSDLMKKYGWPEDFSQKSVPASYLVGFAMGKAAIAQGCEEAVLDVGSQPPQPVDVCLQHSKAWSTLVLKFRTANMCCRTKTESTVLTLVTTSLGQSKAQRNPSRRHTDDRRRSSTNGPRSHASVCS